MAITTKRTQKQRESKKRLTLTSYVVIICILTFAVMSGLLFQQSAISEVNNEIRSLQKNLVDAVQVNDSKEGQLVTNMNLETIESQARGYGMKEPLQEQYRRETMVGGNQVSSSTRIPEVKGWLGNLF